MKAALSPLWLLPLSLLSLSCLQRASVAPNSAGQRRPARPPQVRVSDDGRFLVRNDGTPFFFLADTAWEIFHRLDRQEAISYLETRRAQGYNVILGVALPELSIAVEPNAYGDFPLIEKDPERPAVTPGADPADAQAYDFWDHVDFIVDAANARGLTVGLLPSWARWVNDDKDRIFDERKATAWGRWIGQRYADRSVIWVLGGDRSPAGFESIWRAMAAGIRTAANERHGPRKNAVLMTFHPGAPSTVPFFHHDAWLDFNATYSGHGVPKEPWRLIETAYAQTPVKPVLDLEPIYEDIPYGIANYEHGYSSARDVRRVAYWDVFAGACGAVYGNHATWQMYAPKHKRIYGPLMPWPDALNREGAGQLRHLRALIESRPYFSRRPHQGLLAGPPRAGAHQAATSGDGYAFIYSPEGRPIEIALDQVPARTLRSWWFDPRTGRHEGGERFANDGKPRTFTCPTEGDGADWVLVLDDDSRGFLPPGSPAP